MITTLDCTFRDGGYQCGWEFPLDLVNKYLRIMEKCGIDAVEIGFRSSPNKEIGVFGNVTDEFIDTYLYKPKINYFGVMVNAKEMSGELVNRLFVYQDKSPINLVRVAIYFKDVEKNEYLFKSLKDFGYTITCNLMQAADKSYDEIKRAAKIIELWKSVDVIYIADSFGGMTSDSVSYAFKAIWESWNGLTGFHGHNNKGQALTNSIEAVDIGVDWIDSTILGIGRGAGNTETEYLLNELNKRNYEFDLGCVYEYSVRDFLNLRKYYNWGPSLIYYIAAEYNIHPTYPQKLLERYSNEEVYRALNYLKNIDSKSFSNEIMEKAIK